MAVKRIWREYEWDEMLDTGTSIKPLQLQHNTSQWCIILGHANWKIEKKGTTIIHGNRRQSKGCGYWKLWKNNNNEKFYQFGDLKEQMRCMDREHDRVVASLPQIHENQQPKRGLSALIAWALIICWALALNDHVGQCESSLPRDLKHHSSGNPLWFWSILFLGKENEGNSRSDLIADTAFLLLDDKVSLRRVFVFFELRHLLGALCLLGGLLFLLYPLLLLLCVEQKRSFWHHRRRLLTPVKLVLRISFGL